MMVFSTVTLIGSLLLWTRYQDLLIPSNSKYASAVPNSITLDNKDKITFFQEPESEINPSSTKYYSGLHHPSHLLAVVHHNKTPLSQSSSKLLISVPNLKLLKTYFLVSKTLQEHGKQPNTLEKITKLDAELKWKHHSNEHNIRGREFKILDASKTSQKPNVTKTGIVDYKGQSIDVRDRYHKRQSKSTNQTNAKIVTKILTKHHDNAEQDISSVLGFLYNPVFGNHENNKKHKVSLLDSNVDENHLTRGKEYNNPDDNEHFILNYDLNEAGQHNILGRSIPIYKDNMKDSLRKDNTSRDWGDYKKIRPLETLYALVLYILYQEYEQVEKQTDVTRKNNISQTNSEADFEVYEKGNKLYNSKHLEDQNIKEKENKKKETPKDLLMGVGLTGEKESPSALISDVDHKMDSKYITNSSYNVALISSASFAENGEANGNIVKLVLSLNHTNSTKFEKKYLSAKNNLDSLQPSSVQDSDENGLIDGKEHQRSSGWWRYIILAVSVVVVLMLISLLVICGAKLYRQLKNQKQHLLEILQLSGL